MSNQIKTYWTSLEPRERAILGFGVAFVFIAVFYTFVWKPWQNSLDKMEVSVREMRSNSVWVEQRAADMKGGAASHSNRPKRGADQSLTSVVEQTANQARVKSAIQQIVPNRETGEVQVVLEGVDFNQWVRWVDNLYQNYGVDINQINAEKDDEKPNIAEIRLTFYRP